MSHAAGVQTLRRQLTRAEEEKEAMRKHFGREIAVLEARLEASEREKQQRVAVLESSDAAAQDEASALQQQVRTLRRELASQRAHIHALQTSLASSRAECAELAEELADVLESRNAPGNGLQQRRRGVEIHPGTATVAHALAASLQMLQADVTRLDAARTYSAEMAPANGRLQQLALHAQILKLELQHTEGWIGECMIARRQRDSAEAKQRDLMWRLEYMHMHMR
jgi:chromosome segregation ATPase